MRHSSFGLSAGSLLGLPTRHHDRRPGDEGSRTAGKEARRQPDHLPGTKTPPARRASGCLAPSGKDPSGKRQSHVARHGADGQTGIPCSQAWCRRTNGDSAQPGKEPPQSRPARMKPTTARATGETRRPFSQTPARFSDAEFCPRIWQLAPKCVPLGPQPLRCRQTPEQQANS